MKKTLGIIILAAMLLTSLVIVPASAEVSAPTGQIWEGEYAIAKNAEVLLGTKDFYAQAVNKYNNESQYSAYTTVSFADVDFPSCDAQALWKPASGLPSGKAATDNAVSVKLNVETEGEKTIFFQHMKAKDFGIFDIYFDDTLIADNIDMYSKELYFAELNLGKITVTKGEHTLKFVPVGKNSASTGYLLSVDYFELVGSDNVRRTQKISDRVSGEKHSFAKTVLPDGTIRYEADEMKPSAATAAFAGFADSLQYQCYGKVTGYLTNGWHIYTAFSDTTPAYELEFTVETAGKYDITINSLACDAYGIVQWKIDGVNFGELSDQYSATISNVYVTGQLELTAGTHTISFFGTGNNPAATKTDRRGAFDSLDLRLIPEEPETPPTSDGIAVAFVGVTAAALITVCAVSLLKKKEN